MSASAPNGLTVERSVTRRSGSPRTRMRSPAASASTMSPRWTLSSMPLRSWRTRIGVVGLRRAAARTGVRRGRWAAGAVTGRILSAWDGRALEGRGYRGEGSSASVRLGSTPDPFEAHPPERRPLVPAPNLHVSQHPAVLHKLAILRDVETGAQEVPRGRARAVLAPRLRGAGGCRPSSRSRSERRWSR